MSRRRAAARCRCCHCELLPHCIFQLERRWRFSPAATDADVVTDGKRMTADEAQVSQSVSQSEG